MERVAIFICNGCQPLDVVGPYEVLAAASRACGPKRGGYQVLLAATHRRAVRAESGCRLLPDVTLAELLSPKFAPVQTLIIAGGAGARRCAQEQPDTVQLLRRLMNRADRVASVCTGAFILAAAGMLNGRRATTHWAHCEQLAALFPRVRVEPDPIYLRDGKYWTSAGVTAGIDLTLALVEADCGRDVAMNVARELVVFVRRAGGQSQFSAPLAAQIAQREPIRELQDFIVEHPDAALSVPAMAKRAGMSLRHFARVFRAEVGVAPAAYVQRVRVETARRLLETTRLPLDRIAEAAGFGIAANLRRSLGARLGLGPREYRARFGAIQKGART